MITINSQKCSRCGLCADLCHESCIAVLEDGPHIDQMVCSACTQCIAACPQQALSWEGVTPEPFERRRLPMPEQLDEIFKERRSIRRFKRKKIERALLEEIGKYGGYAPTHAFSLRVTDKITDRQKLAPQTRDYINRRTPIDYATYVRYRKKLTMA